MWAVYKNDLWETEIGVRENLFQRQKENSPNTLIKIRKGGEVKEVKIKELQDYTLYRNNGIRS